MPAGTVVASGSLISPGGQQGLPGPNGVSTDAGNIATLGSDNLVYVPQTFGKYYGTDPTNVGNLVVTVDASFALLPGVTVYVTPTATGNGLTANPTLNVNGTGAKPIVNRANIALFAYELNAQKTFGVTYDGTSWRVITFLTRCYTATNPASTTSVECLGFDAVAAFVQFTLNTSCNLTLAHLGEGTDVYVLFGNGYTTALNYSISANNPTGAAITTLWCPNTSTVGIAATGMSASLSLSITNGLNAAFQGRVLGGRILFK